jgi:hypothetical protein
MRSSHPITAVLRAAFRGSRAHILIDLVQDKGPTAALRRGLKAGLARRGTYQDRFAGLRGRWNRLAPRGDQAGKVTLTR